MAGPQRSAWIGVISREERREREGEGEGEREGGGGRGRRYT